MNALDAAILLKNIVTQTDSGSKGDFNGDGNVNSLDAAAILRYAIA